MRFASIFVALGVLAGGFAAHAGDSDREFRRDPQGERQHYKPEEEKDSPRAGDTSPWFGFLTGGMSLAAGTNYTQTFLGFPSIISESSAAAPTFGAEILFKALPNLSLSGVFEYSQYKKPNGLNSDNEYGFYLMPRLQKVKGITTIWVGAGLGLVATTFGSTLLQSPAPNSFIESTTRGFSFSPRVGVDFEFIEDFYVGAQLSFTAVWGTFTGYTGTAFGIGVPFTDDYYRHWLGLSARVGMNF